MQGCVNCAQVVDLDKGIFYIKYVELCYPQAIVYTLKESYRELGLLVFLVVISGFIFASLCYFIEIDEGSGFTSIPAAFYWVVITMTTVSRHMFH